MSSGLYDVYEPTVFEEIVRKTLFSAYDTVHGKEGLKSTTSTSVDISTKGDAVAGEAMVAYLKKLITPNVGVVFTEEQGKVTLNKDGQYSVILDDIDGSKNYKEGFGMLPHGSIAGIFKGRDPRFCDCIAAGYLDFPSGNLFYATKEMGCFVQDDIANKQWAWDHKEARRLTTTGRKKVFTGKNLTLLPDLYMLGDLAPAFMEYAGQAWLGDFRTTAAQLALVAAGSADIFVAGDNAFNPNKRRTGEEIGPGYLLITEAGGSLTDWLGNDIGKEKVGMGEKRTWHYIAAATPELALEFSRDMWKKPAIKEYMKKKGLNNVMVSK